MNNVFNISVMVLKALADKTRLRILSLLAVQSLCVCELTEILALSQPAVSQHLRRLKDAGLVGEDKRKQWVYYELRKETIYQLCDVLKDLHPIEEDKALLQNIVASGNACQRREQCGIW